MSLTSLSAAIDKLAAAVKRLDNRPPAWSEGATVAAVGSPVSVLLDSDASGTARDVSVNWAGPVSIGQRVRVVHQGSRLILVDTSATMNVVKIDQLGASSFDDLTAPGWYQAEFDSTAQGLTNFPGGGRSGVLQVLPGRGDGHIQVYYETADAVSTHSRTWRRINPDLLGWEGWTLVNKGSHWPEPSRLHRDVYVSVSSSTNTLIGGWNLSYAGGEIPYSYGVFTCPTDSNGTYRIAMGFRWTNYDFTTECQLVINGSQKETIRYRHRHSDDMITAVFIAELVEGDEIAIRIRQSSGSSQTWELSYDTMAWYSCARVG